MSEERWWEHDVSRVMQEVDDFYARVAVTHPDKDKLPFTKKKIIEVREWEETRRMFEKNFDVVLKQLGFFYIPNRLIPGPAFIFPIKDADGKYTSAQTKPLEGSVLAGLGKYRYIGEKHPLGPRWLGNDHATLKRIVDTRKVMVVEGPFDILAARLLCPDVPILSPLTKLVGKQHIAYLRMLGVNHLVLMYDNEEAKEGKKGPKMGAGNLSMEQQRSLIKDMQVTALDCPKPDPSECLQDTFAAEKLRKIIRKQFQY